MFWWFFICLGYWWMRKKQMRWQDFLLIAAYFAVASICATISFHLFPPFIGGDEGLYHDCGVNLAKLISTGAYWNFSDTACNVNPNNYFAQAIGYVYFIFGSSPLSTVGMNIFWILVACDLFSQSWNLQPEVRERILRVSLFMPPILMLAIRPGKEATVTFLLSAIFFVWHRAQGWMRLLGLAICSLLMFWVRWQYVIAIWTAIGLWLFWKGLSRFRNPVKVRIAVGLVVFLCCLLLPFQKKIVNFVNTRFIYAQNVAEFANRPDGPMIYRVMLYKNHENSLHPWNIFVAHAGGFVTPHPLRFIKESMRASEFLYHVFEEFIYVSLWFYLLLPIYGLYFKKTFIRHFSTMEQIDSTELFKLILVSILFSLACFSLLFQTPQLYRYKIPLNLYLFSTIAYYCISSGWPRLKQDLRKNRWMIGAYFGFLVLYSCVYFR